MSDYDEILIALRRITRAIDLRSRRLMAVSGLTAPQIIMLRTVFKHTTVSASQLAKEIMLSQATVTSILERLEKGGLIVKSRSDSDRRVVNITLTPEGVRRMNAAPELLQAGFLRKLRKLKDWERSQLISSLQRVGEMMDAEDIDASPILEAGELLTDLKDSNL